jgi:hypothetical protein
MFILGISIFGKDAEIFGICIFTLGKLGTLKTGVGIGGKIFGKLKLGKGGKDGKGGKLIGGIEIGGKLGSIAARLFILKGGNFKAAESQDPNS